MKNLQLITTSASDTIDCDIKLDSAKIGYVQYFELEEDSESFCYIASIDISEEHRNHGYGSEIIKKLAEKYGKVYLCPTSEDSERLYKRLGEEVDYGYMPSCLEGSLDEYGKMYLIEA